MNAENQRPENPFLNIAFNILLPVVILNQLSDRFGDKGPLIALLVALALPIGYGIYDFATRKKKNLLSIVGIVNVLLTGGLALMHIEGIWFAVKEAAFPLLIGIVVYISAFTAKPFIRFIACNPSVMNMKTIDARLIAAGKQEQFDGHLRFSTKLVAVSFFLSSLLNFGLARYVFTDIDPTLSETQHSAILNEQIADMTWMSFIVIVAPLMIFTGFIMWHLITGIQKMTGLPINDILPDQGRSQSAEPTESKPTS